MPFKQETDANRDADTSDSAAQKDEKDTSVEEAPVTYATLSFVGDLLLSTMPGRYNGEDFLWYAEKEGPAYFLSGVADLFHADTYTFGNLETVLSDRELTPIGKNYSPAYWYRSPTWITSILTEGGIDIVSLANNHTGDFGEEGLADTRAAIEQAGLLWGDSDVTLMLHPGNANVAVYCCRIRSDGNCREALDWLKTVRDTTDFQIIYFHGGASMFRHTMDDNMREACHRLVDEGADLIVGHHPHVLQQVEWYRNVLIVPSLGALIFGDGKMENVSAILQIELEIGSNGVKLRSTKFLPFALWGERKWQPALLQGEAAERVLGFLAGEYDTPL